MSESATYTPLLPPNQTPLEGALVRSGEAPDTAAAVGWLRDLHAPERAPAPLLPWLAWQTDVPIWPADMPEAVRRGLVRDSARLHRLAGTEAGLAALARYAGAELVEAITPRRRIFCGRNMTVDERNADRARYPELRRYPFRRSGVRRTAMCGRMYCGSGRPQDFPGTTDAAARLSERVTRVDRGVETELTTSTVTLTRETREAVTVRRVALPGRVGYGTFCGARPRFLITSDAAARLVTVTERAQYQQTERTLHVASLRPGLEPLDLAWEWAASRGQRRGIYCGAGGVGGHFLDPHAEDRLFRRQYLFDPARAPAARGAVSFVTGYFPPAPHTALLRCRLRGQRPARAVSRFAGGYFLPADQGRYRLLQEALRWGSAARDRAWLSTRTRAVARAGSHRAGSLLAGQFTEV